MAPYSRLNFADGPASDQHERVLRCVCRRGENASGARVNAHSVAEELGIQPNELFRTILSLVDYGFLKYIGAGPVVEITRLGSRRCGEDPSATG